MNKKQISLFATNISLKTFKPYAEERFKYHTLLIIISQTKPK